MIRALYFVVLSAPGAPISATILALAALALVVVLSPAIRKRREAEETA